MRLFSWASKALEKSMERGCSCCKCVYVCTRECVCVCVSVCVRVTDQTARSRLSIQTDTRLMTFDYRKFSFGH